MTDQNVDEVVMQTTTLCNLNCSYCYLPGREKNLLMPIEVAHRVAQGLTDMNAERVRIVWFGGEPLNCGIERFRLLINQFEHLRKNGAILHGVQTNATKIDQKWCDLFRSYGVGVGVSIDGPVFLNNHRVNWGGDSSYELAMKGIRHLREAQIDFKAICVVTRDSLTKAGELYEFFCELGCSLVGFNIEEKEGMHTATSCTDQELAINFWSELFDIWKKNPKIQIREFSMVLNRMHNVIRSESRNCEKKLHNLMPSIDYGGNVMLLSPEFIGHSDFIVGNVLKEPFVDILNRWREISYVNEFHAGVKKCKEQCQYFEYCRGGQASNKFFELGSVNGTETVYCRNSRQSLVEGILRAL